jgi:hypothetical protein
MLNTFELEGKVSAYQINNATNNNTALVALNAMLQTRLRCLSYMINLVVKALLFSTKNTAFQKDLREANDADSFVL